ncbi:MAG TPA: immunoglobulin domain-containing protein, partial [Opitutaceae bacterium]|nr:immunoglobulin domain-containing protein [Opitutaceae bacterium]
TYSIEGGNTRVLGETRQFVTAGDGTWSSFGALSFAAGTVWENQGALALTTTGSLSGGTFNNTVSGTVTRSGSGTSHIVSTFNNAGTVSVASGTLQLSGNGSDTGTYNISADATVAMTTGARTLQSGASIAGAGAFVQSGGTLTVAGTIPAVNYRMNGGTLNGAGQLNITGLFTWTIGTMSGTGTTHVAVGGTYSIEGGNTRVLSETRQFVTAGDGTWSSFGALSFATGTVWENQGALALATTGSLSGGTFNNSVSGTVTRSGTGISTIANTFNNAGTVNVASGTLQLSGNGSDTGTYNISAGATLGISSGTRTWEASAIVGGSGMVNRTGGTLVNHGTVRPGSSPGVLSWTGAFPMSSSDAALRIEIAGLDAGTGHGQLAVSGTATLAGSVEIVFGGGFLAVVGQEFTVLTATSIVGAFEAIGTSGLPDGTEFEIVAGATSIVLRVTAGTGTGEVPAITSHPASQTVDEGDPATFTVVATGTAPLSYQWKKGGVDISGATSATYSIANVTAGDAGIYTVVVSNFSGSVTSNAATLSVNVPPAITSHPTSLTAVLGSDVAFSVTASGTNPLSFQWRLNGGNITGATSATLTLTNVHAGNAGTYTCVVTNVAGSATSDPATLTLDSTPRIINVSCLASAGAGDSTLVMGFYISGTGAKTLLIRGIGPELANYTVADHVPDPSITVYDSDGVEFATNNDWNAALAADFTRVGAFALANGSKDAAFKVTLGPGLYTVHLVNSAPVARGLIEVYDFSRDSGTRLTNVSCRLAMIPGETVILGTAVIANSRSMLARAVGPELVTYNIPADQVLVDPRLRAHSGLTVIGENDDWELATRAYFGPTGAFDLEDGSKDAALRVVAAPGEFTIHATGNGGGGVALIEIYESP